MNDKDIFCFGTQFTSVKGERRMQTDIVLTIGMFRENS